MCLLTRPEDIDKWTEDERRRWLNDHGYDLSVDVSEKGVWLHAVATNMVVVAGDRWSEGDLSWVTTTLQPGASSSPLIFWELPKGVLPITFAFRTLSGIAGVFRVVAYSMERRNATIQIRLA